jgi:hypothetical protein
LLLLLGASFLQKLTTKTTKSWGLVVGFLLPLKMPLHPPSSTL